MKWGGHTLGTFSQNVFTFTLLDFRFPWLKCVAQVYIHLKIRQILAGSTFQSLRPETELAEWNRSSCASSAYFEIERKVQVANQSEERRTSVLQVSTKIFFSLFAIG
jgi:hypothetical protein